MDRILVADDGLAVALCVIEVTVDLAKKTGAELSAITVADPTEDRQTEITMSTGVAHCCASFYFENPNREAIGRQFGMGIIDLAREHDVDLIVLCNRRPLSPAETHPWKRLAKGGEHRRLLRHDGALIGAHKDDR